MNYDNYGNYDNESETRLELSRLREIIECPIFEHHLVATAAHLGEKLVLRLVQPASVHRRVPLPETPGNYAMSSNKFLQVMNYVIT